MPQFFYRAYTGQGTVTTGTISADQRKAAIEALYVSGLTPFETFEEFASNAAPSSRLSPTPEARPPKGDNEIRIDLRALSRFSVELSSLLNSGMSIEKAFRIMIASDPRGRVGQLAQAILNDVLAGAQLGEAIAARPRCFGSDYRAIVAAGEASGTLAQALTQICALLQRRIELRNKIVSALVYPLVILMMSVLSVGVIIGVLIPNLAPVFTDAGLPLPGILASFAKIGDHWELIATIAGMPTLALWGGLRASARSPSARQTRDQMLCAVPIIGPMIRIREAAAFLRALGTLVSSHAPLMASLETSADLVGNAYMALRYREAIARVSQGISLNRVLADADLIPQAGLSLIAIGEETGQLGRILIDVATSLEANFQRQIERLVGLMTPVLTLCVGVGVGGLILQVMTAVLSINDLAFQ